MITTINTLTNKAAGILVAQTDGTGGAGVGKIDTGAAAKTITDSTLWTSVIGPLSVGIAIIVLLFGVYKVITQIASGKTQGAVKTIGLTLLVGGLLFRLDLLFTLIEGAGNVVASIVSAIVDLIGGGGA
jgi:hypothetical protein